MKPPLALLTLALLGFAVAACGGGSKGAGPVSRTSSRVVASGGAAATSTTPNQSYFRGDGDDDDIDEKNRDDHDNYTVHRYGHKASAADGRAIISLVKRYYATAVAGDGARGCSLIYAHFANDPNLGTIAEGYPVAPSVPPLRGKSCAHIMSLLFKESHRQLAAELAGLQVTDVRVKGRHGLALLAFRATPERLIPVEREGGGAWKVASLFDKALP
jgi:hypothetical protein